MTDDDRRALIARYAAAWRANDRAAWLVTFAADATQEDPVGARVRHGRDDIGEFWDDAMAGYRSLAIEPQRIFVVGGEAAMVWTILAEDDDGWLSFDGVDVFTFDEATGLIASVRAYWERGQRRRLPPPS